MRFRNLNFFTASEFLRSAAWPLDLERSITTKHLKRTMRLWVVFIAATIIGADAASAQQSNPAIWRYGPYDKNIQRKLTTVTNFSTAPPRPPAGGAIVFVPPRTNSTNAVLLKLQTNSPPSSQIVTNRQSRPQLAPKPKD